MKHLNKLRFAYIFPTNLEHPGLAIKYQGQLAAFEKKYNVKAVYFKYNVSDSFVSKWFKYLYFEFCSVMAILFSEKVYIRYNPKALITNFCLPFFKSKMIYVEINTIFDYELKLLDRKSEYKWNTYFMNHFNRSSSIIYTCVTKEIQQDMIDRYDVAERRTRFIQNGYQLPVFDANNVDQETLSRVKRFYKKYPFIGVFVGGGYAWHGVDELIEFSHKYPSLGFIIISINNVNIDRDNILVLQQQIPVTICEIYKYCHFGISSFRLNLKGLSEGSSLKTREYLCHGLVILTHELDCVEYIDVLKPYVFNIRQNPDVFDLLLTINDKVAISKLASQRLAWDSLLKDI